MIKTQIQLTEDQFQALRRLAAQQDKSVAELIQQNIDQLIRSAGSADMQERRRRAIAAAGQFCYGHNDLSTDHDRYLTETYQSAFS